MVNTLLTPQMITRKSLMVLHQKLNFIGNVTRDYDDSFAKTGAKIGDTLKIRLPNQYTVGTSATISPQATAETSVSLQINNVRNVAMDFTSSDMTLSLDDFSERVIEPAMAVLAASIEADVLTNVYKDVYNQVNNHGASATFNKVLAARKMLVDNLAPVNDRNVTLNTQDNQDLVDGLKGLFNAQEQLAKQYKEGYLGRTAGFDFAENTLLPSHTRGAENTAYTTSTLVGVLPIATAPVTQIAVITGAGAGNKGDVFTIGGVYRVHPETRLSTGVLQQFVLTADYAGGAGNMQISPSIILSGAYQNVIIPSTSATAALSFAGTASATSGISLAFQKSAFAFATADLILPKGLDFAARDNMDGISMRILRDYDVTTDRLITRADVIYGYKTLRPQLAARMANN